MQRRARGRSLVAIQITRDILPGAPDLEQRWAGGGTLLHGVRTSGAEATARGGMHGIRGVPHERWTIEAFVRVHRGGRCEQGLRIGMQRSR